MDARRKALLGVRDAIDPEQRRLFSKSICFDIINSSEYKNAKNVMCYCAIGSEVQLDTLIAHALQSGKRVLLPVCDKDTRTMVAHFYEGELKSGAYGISEPTGEQGIPDIIICPMLAFNKERYRIGYGAGYYDRYLKKSNAVFFGAAFSVQKAEFDPNKHDVPLHRIYTQEEIF